MHPDERRTEIERSQAKTPALAEARSPLPHVLLAIYLLVTLLAFTWPVYDMLGNRVEPVVFGLPFTFAWNVGWVLSTFVVLCLYHRARGEEG